MSTELNLVTQLATILVAAGVFTIISKALKQPLILGYIVAGFIVGPKLGLIPQFSPESVHQWSDLGIIFLLFGLGLEFSFKKLLGVGSTAVIAAGTICIGMFMMGFVTGTSLEWSNMESIFLGGMLSMSSTTIIIKAYDDLGIKKKSYATLVFGLLVVEDLLAVLMMVLFSTLAVSNKFSGSEVIYSLAKLSFFLIICFLVGIFVLPSLLKRAKKYLSEEILLLASIGLCFVMVLLANAAGFSSALGAFIMGSILSSTIEGERIEHTIGNIKNLFGAIFFVSVGMMVDPEIIVSYWDVILIITIVAMSGILIFSTGGVLLSGKGLDTALHVGFSLPQLGEFSFIIAGLGVSLGVMRDFIYPVIISVSVITTFTTPYMIKAADPVSKWLHAKLPQKVVTRLYQGESHRKNEKEESTWRKFIKEFLIRVILYVVVLIAISLACHAFLPKLSALLLPDFGKHMKYAFEIVVYILVMSPFLYDLAASGTELKLLSMELVETNRKNAIPIFVFIFIRISLAAVFVLSAIMWHYQLEKWNILLAMSTIFLIFVAARKKAMQCTGIEQHFFSNLNEKEQLNKLQNPIQALMNEKMANYNIFIDGITISSDFQMPGVPLLEMDFIRQTGVNIIKIKRGSRSIVIPSAKETLYPGDYVLVVGSKEQIEEFAQAIKHKSTIKESKDKSADDFTVEKHTLTNISYLSGKILYKTEMRKAGCMVISVIRDGELISNPPADFLFQTGDQVWFAGIKSSIHWYK